MRWIDRMIYKFSRKRKQCNKCGKTFYKPINTFVEPLDWEDWTVYEDWVSPCCHTYWR